MKCSGNSIIASDLDITLSNHKSAWCKTKHANKTKQSNSWETNYLRVPDVLSVVASGCMVWIRLTRFVGRPCCDLWAMTTSGTVEARVTDGLVGSGFSWWRTLGGLPLFFLTGVSERDTALADEDCAAIDGSVELCPTSELSDALLFSRESEAGTGWALCVPARSGMSSWLWRDCETCAIRVGCGDANIKSAVSPASLNNASTDWFAGFMGGERNLRSVRQKVVF